MHKSQANRARIAARAAAASRGTAPNTGARASTDLLARAMTPVKPYGFTGTRRHGNKARMTDAQKDSTGRFSDWNRSPYEPKGGWR